MLQYHYWARDRMLDSLKLLTKADYVRDMGSSHKSIRDTAVHIFAAELVWYSRWTGPSPTGLLPVRRVPDVPTLQSVWWDLEMAVRLFARGLGPDGVNRSFRYTTLNGMPASSRFWEMVQHVVNHGSYHRGQITTMLRQIGAAPPQSTDQIAFLRMWGQLAGPERQSA